MDQVRNNLLSRISRFRVSPELGIAEVSCQKMDEVGYTQHTLPGGWSSVF